MATPGSGTVKLALGDVDSGTIVPKSSPRFGGSYVITDQTALELVFANNIFNGTGLTVLKTQFGLDDLLWTTSPGGTLYVVDIGSRRVLPKRLRLRAVQGHGPVRDEHGAGVERRRRRPGGHGEPEQRQR